MYQKLIIFLFILFLSFACSKKEVETNAPPEEEQAFIIYREAIDLMNEGEMFVAAKKFSEAESILPRIELSAKAALMSSYCLYGINFYDEAIENLERYIIKYPADKNIPYAHYLIAISLYEQILDEKKDIAPLIKTREKIEFYLSNYPDNEYAVDLKFKKDLILNQLAAKELYVAKYYIENQKWIAAINRLKVIVNEYDDTIFIEEALHRLVEIYYKIGLEEEAKAAASVLGYNYNSSEWYKQSYKVLNKDYKIAKKVDKKKSEGIISRTIRKILK